MANVNYTGTAVGHSTAVLAAMSNVNYTGTAAGVGTAIGTLTQSGTVHSVMDKGWGLSQAGTVFRLTKVSSGSQQGLTGVTLTADDIRALWRGLANLVS